VKRRGVAEVARVAERLGLGRRCIIVEDTITKEVAGRSVGESLAGEGYKVAEVLVRVASEESVNLVCAEMCSYDFAVAVGGGSVIDTAKYAAHKREIPFISFPTAPSHDGIVSPTVSLTSAGRRPSIYTRPPVAAVVDLDVLSGAPRKIVTSGCGDVLSKAVSLKDWALGRDERGEHFCDFSASLALWALERAIEFIKRGGIGRLASALIACGISMIVAGSSRPCSGSEHLFSHYLDVKKGGPAMHGEQCGVGAVLMARYHELHNENWWREEKYGWRSLRTLLQAAGAPSTPSQLGIDRRVAVEAILNASAIRPERYTILHKRPPSPEEAERLVAEVEGG